MKKLVFLNPLATMRGEIFVYKMEKNEEMLLEIWIKALESRTHEL